MIGTIKKSFSHRQSEKKKKIDFGHRHTGKEKEKKKKKTPGEIGTAQEKGESEERQKWKSKRVRTVQGREGKLSNSKRKIEIERGERELSCYLWGDVVTR